jgi:hypothetical protein
VAGGKPTMGDRRSGRGPRPTSGRAGVEKVASVTAVKKQIRGVQRMLNKPNLPAEAKTKQEALLAKLSDGLRDATKKRRERHRSTKYHKVKFFERQKCDRRIKQTERKLQEATDASARAELEKQLEAHRTDMQYIRYYPPEQKYISLYAAEQDDAGFLEKRRLKMRTLVAKRIADGKGRTDQDEDEEDEEADGGEQAEEDDFFLAK